MIANVGVSKNNTESTASVIRRFTKRAQGAGIVRQVRSSRYYKRSPSKYVKKKDALKSLEKRAHYHLLSKLGKLPDKKKGRRRSK